MADYLTRAQLLSFRPTLTEAASDVRKAENQALDGATFLSHATKDQDLLPGVIKFLEEHGARVYIDKKDGDLPPYTNQDTAQQLKSRVRKSKNFILLTTEKSKDSRWIPWELGLADGHKGSSKIAILPGVDKIDDTQWTEQEYLGIYDRIMYGKIRGIPGDVYMVLDREKNEAMTLRDWLSS